MKNMKKTMYIFRNFHDFFVKIAKIYEKFQKIAKIYKISKKVQDFVVSVFK